MNKRKIATVFATALCTLFWMTGCGTKEHTETAEAYFSRFETFSAEDIHWNKE